MNERLIIPSKNIIKLQKKASNPKFSAWVEAHAGSGKTHVLSERVIRLLLEGTEPQNLLCLTYTKAAAAEMRSRITNHLAKWAIITEKELVKILKDLTEKTPDKKQIMRARTLFASALETPGGLKINTIHAFCESLLHRFALEADVPINFSVIEEVEQKNLIKKARNQILAKGISNKANKNNSVKKLFSLLGDYQIEKALDEAIAKRAELTPILADKKQAKNMLCQIMQHDGSTIDELKNKFMSGSYLSKEIWQLARTLEGGKFINSLKNLNFEKLTAEQLLKLFLTKEGAIRKTLLLKKQAEDYPQLAQIIDKEAERLFTLTQKIKIAHIVACSKAFIDVLGDIFDLYEQKKRHLLALDYDDLIDKTGQLLTNAPSMDWVLYKLDANISHILIDESQDTNPRQWAIVNKLWEDFFSGLSAIEIHRTIFGVGDKKQSIFSFQGADPAIFAKTGKELAKRAQSSNKILINSELKTSFRTLENILLAIDRVFNDEQMDLALLLEGKKLTHQSARADKGGSIILWPPIKQEEEEQNNQEWPLDSANIVQYSNESLLAKRIIANIKHWIDNKRPLAQRGRAIEADDILILVQKRSSLFYEIIRELKRAGLETPGSDKLMLSSNIVVMDLLTLGDFLLNLADDLSLATILRSPLFDIDEETLFKIAAKRPQNCSLWQALKNSPLEKAKAAHQTLSSWRQKLDFERPYEFFADILYRQGGLKKFHARLGNEIDDILFQFLELALAYESESQPSLLGFIAKMRQSEIYIKRELSEKGKGVRIMSVHGAKGLEAPIVILADAGLQSNFKSKSLYFVNEKRGATLIYGASESERLGVLEELYEQDKEDDLAEYWRKLYVAMTRAEDELYITGTLNKKTNIDNTWYGKIYKALEKDCQECAIIGEEEKGLIFPKKLPKAKEITKKPPKASEQISDFKIGKFKQKNIREIINPSNYREEIGEIFATNSELAKDASFARQKGIALHALLQHLCNITPDLQMKIAKKALQILLPDKKEWHDELAKKAISILSNKNFEFLFGKNSRSEVAFLANGQKNGTPISLAGRIDRIIIEKNNILIIDFKSDSSPPKNLDEIPPHYLSQMALYVLVAQKIFKQYEIEGAIFWTQSESLTKLPKNLLQKYFSDFSLEKCNISNY